MNQQPSICTGRFALLHHQESLEGDGVAMVDSRSQHAAERSHWDLLLESHEERLLTWRIEALPELAIDSGHPPKGIIGKRIADHRQLYLHYQGPISGNRGCVSRLATGNYWAMRDSAPGDSDANRAAFDWTVIDSCQSNNQYNRHQLLAVGAGYCPPTYLWLKLNMVSCEARLGIELTEVGQPTVVHFFLWPQVLCIALNAAD